MPKVLIVDDVADNVELLAYALEDQGYEVFKACDGIRAIEAAERCRPDVILLDILMPGTDGIEVCRRLKANPALESIPVIMVSALEEDADLIRGLDAGAQDDIIKPYNVAVAISRVQIVLARLRSAAMWKLAENALKDREQRFHAVFNQTFQFTGLLDLDGVVLEVNQVALDWIEADRESVVGRPLWEGPWWTGLPQVRAQLEAGIAETALGRIVNFDSEHPRKDGETVDLEFSLMPVTDNDGRVSMMLVVGHDVTDRKRAQEAMCLAKEAAEAASKAKGEFLANVSHEIRTPMNAILGMTELTLDSDLDPEQRENLKIIRTATDSLLAVINDLLDFSRMEAGKLELDPVAFELRGHLGEIMALLRRRAHAKGLELLHRVDPDVPDQLIGDPVRLRQILVNLVGNAIKFTERGEIVVEINLDPGTRGEGNVPLHIRVIDTGIGIPADRLDAVFAPFTQADGSSTRRYGGTGLGLAISSQLVGLMSGRIWVESEVGRGSTFHLIVSVGQPKTPQPGLIGKGLGRRPPTDQPPSPLVPLAARPTPRSLRILMAEDNPFNQKVATLMLAKLGHSVTTVDNGRAAIAALERQPFNLVLMDLQMPEMDGFHATAAIRAAEAGTGGHIPIIALTAHAMKEDRDRCLEAGMDNFVTKPIHQEKLREAIEECLSLIRETAAVKLPAGTEEGPMDMAVALARIDGDRVFLGEMAAMFLAESPGLMVQIGVAIREGNAASLVAPAHNLKNWAGNFAAEAMFAELARMEAFGRAGSLEETRAVYLDLEREFERLTQALARFDPGAVPPDDDDTLLAISKDHRSPACTH